MANQNGATTEFTAVPLLALIPAGVRSPEIVAVTARWSSPMGIELSTRPIRYQLGLPLNLIVHEFIKAVNQGLVKQVLKDAEHQPILDAEGKAQLVPIQYVTFAIVPPPPPKPVSRIIT